MIDFINSRLQWWLFFQLDDWFYLIQVAIAAVLESTSEPMKIQISETTFDILEKKNFSIQPAGTRSVPRIKNLKTYWLLNKKVLNWVEKLVQSKDLVFQERFGPNAINMSNFVILFLGICHILWHFVTLKNTLDIYINHNSIPSNFTHSNAK